MSDQDYKQKYRAVQSQGNRRHMLADTVAIFAVAIGLGLAFEVIRFFVCN